MCKFAISHVCALPAGCFPVPYVFATLQPIPPENMRQSARTWNVLCFSGFVAHTLAVMPWGLAPATKPRKTAACTDGGCRIGGAAPLGWSVETDWD